MRKNFMRFIRLFNYSATLLLFGCGPIDNAPQPSPLPKASILPQKPPLWDKSIGTGTKKDYLKLTPVVATQPVIFTADKSGTVSALNPRTGKVLWATKQSAFITAGPSLESRKLFIITDKPELIALDAATGSTLWSRVLPNQSLARPAIKKNYVVVKTLDGQLIAWHLGLKRALWHYPHKQSSLLILRASSAPQIIKDKVIAGFPDGQLVAIHLPTGRILWKQVVAEPKQSSEIAQRVDIAADPLSDSGVAYVACYQGNVAAISLENGHILWTRKLSTYTGLALGKALYITDEKGVIWALDRFNGQVLWKNEQLKNRRLTAPTLVGPALLVAADEQAYLHTLSQKNGKLISSLLVKKRSQIINPPVVRGSIVYVVTHHGHLSAWKKETLTRQ